MSQADIDALPDAVSANPTHIWIEPTDRCNTRCTHCGHFYGETFGQDMDGDLYAKIRDSVLGDVERAELIGYGEPLMAKLFGEMFDDCVARDIEILTTTNGILLLREELVAKIVRNRVVLCISIDGARRETFEFVRPLIKWEKMLEILERVRRAAEEAGPDRRFRLRFNYVAMKRTIGDLPDLVRLAAKFGAEEIFVLPLGGEEVFEKMHGQSLQGSPELLTSAYLEALRLAGELGVHLTVPASFRALLVDGANCGYGVRARVRRLARRVRLASLHLRGRGLRQTLERLRKGGGPRGKAGLTFCTMPWRDAYFASDGTVFPCCIMQERLGDMKTQAWEEIWNGPLYRNLRRTVHSWNPSAVCRHCALPSGINGGDEMHHEKFFAKFRAETIPLDASGLEFGDGFHDLETLPDGAPSHRWMGLRGALSAPMRRGAKLLRLQIIPRMPVPATNPGSCRVNGGSSEPFDNSCPDVHFPLAHVRGDRLRVDLEMESAHIPGNEDTRRLGLAVRGVQLLL